MAIKDIRLSLLTFPQRFRGNALECRVLLLPASDPLIPLGPGLPRFAGTDWELRARVLPGLDSMLGPLTAAVPFDFTAAAPPDAVALFEAMRTEFNIVPPRPLAERIARHKDVRIRKHLPESYTTAFPFERPREGTSVGNEFGCALREEEPARKDDPKPPRELTWGAALSFALRQPRLARALGILHDVTVPADGVDLTEGGWIYTELTAANPAVRSYAARLPELTEDRRLFAAVLFPLGLPGNFGQPLAEAAIYDDGFAKIVHAAQAVTADSASSGHNELRPATDAGIDLGWDDEQVTVWLNRQLDVLGARLNGTSALEAPMGVAGYRIDVRLPEEPGLDGWQSLCEAFSSDADGNPAPLSFPAADPVFSEPFDGELTVEPTPVRSIHAKSRAAWLPQHFARWQGGSLVVADDTLFRLAGETPRDAEGNPLSVPPPVYAAPPIPVPLRYGKLYELRCRLADLTGGGPEAGEDPVHPAPSPTTEVRFLRHVQPKALRIKTDVPPREPDEPNPVARIDRIQVWRPLLGYPELEFAGVGGPAVIEALLLGRQEAKDRGDAVGVNDPDVTHVRVEVQVRTPAHDPGPAGLRDGDFRVLYTVERELPPFDAGNLLHPGVPLTFALDYVDQPDVADLDPPPAGELTLPIPRARDVRLRLTPVCADRPSYFGPGVREGLVSVLSTRADASAEPGLLVSQADQLELEAILLQPAPDRVQRLAAQLSVDFNGLTLTGRRGERVVFGASAAIRHMLSGDRGSITFASEDELHGRWIAAIQVELDRDWTWDGLEDDGIQVSRDGRIVGQVQVPFAVPPNAVAGPDQPGKDRRARTRIVFLDAVDPNPPKGEFPRTLSPSWSLAARLRELPGAADLGTLKVDLPIAVRPRQMPRLAAAGIALSPYDAAEDYSSTEPRRRALWFELEEPIEDPNDALYARVLAYGPDPLLSGTITHRLVPVADFKTGGTDLFQQIEKSLPHPPEPPPLAIDPEPVRVIVPQQSDDQSGLDAMDEMIEAVSAGSRPRHFLVPLPRGVDPDSPEMFGFWTYELRVGHKKLWSTAQARFGRPLEVRGVQHPAPTLQCSAFRVNPKGEPPRIVVTAPHATAFFADERLTHLQENDPRTRIWALLYAQVTQADGRTRRNVLLGRALAVPRFDFQDGRPVLPSTRDVIGVAQFEQPAVERVLADLALPLDAPLSVLAVELLPGDGLTQRVVRFPSFLDVLEAAPLYVNEDIPEALSGEHSFFAGIAGRQSDPLGRELGSLSSRRILRCSPLTPVAPAC